MTTLLIAPYWGLFRVGFQWKRSNLATRVAGRLTFWETWGSAVRLVMAGSGEKGAIIDLIIAPNA